MSTLGFAMICHTALHRAAQVARHWAERDCPVVIHVDKSVARDAFNDFRRSLADLDNVRFCRRHRCEWGTWSLVEASQTASEMLLEAFPSVRHVYLVSGSCLPLRPVEELRSYLTARPMTDFIESVTISEVDWTVGGLNEERFEYRFPFSWKRQRFLFDRYVELQRRLGLVRDMPEGITPHLGSQWWCLSRQTLSAILEDPRRREMDRYFRHVWIPDESYYQTLVRNYGRRIESRSLTLSKFDFQGKPHVFYDDHLHLLRRSDCFVARKVWPRADRLYRTFLSAENSGARMTEPAPGKIDRVFSKALERRTRGRPGLYMHSRYPNPGWENGITAGPYSVFHGFNDLFLDFDGWMSRRPGSSVHGNIFAPRRARFTGGADVYAGGLSASAKLRDYNPEAFLSNLIWNTRGSVRSSCSGRRTTSVPAHSWPMTTTRRSRSSPGPGRSGCSHPTGISRISGPRQGACNGRRRSSSRRCATARAGPISGSGRWPISSKRRWRTCKVSSTRWRARRSSACPRRRAWWTCKGSRNSCKACGTRG
jgi:hypothetical protein